jgi:hypothetical protein
LYYLQTLLLIASISSSITHIIDRYGQRSQSNPSYLHWQSLMQKMFATATEALLALSSFGDKETNRIVSTFCSIAHIMERYAQRRQIEYDMTEHFN